MKKKRYNKHRHQRCKAPSLCKTFFITSYCRLKEAGQKNYLTTSFSQRLSHTVFLTTSFSLCLFHHVLFTTSFSQNLSNTVALTNWSTQRSPHKVTIFVLSFCAVQISKNISNLSKFRPLLFHHFLLFKLKPPRCTSTIYILSLYDVSEP